MPLLFAIQSLHAPHIIPDQEISSLVGRHEPFQRIAADNGLSPDIEDRNLFPLHQLPHGVPPDAAALGGFLNGHTHLDRCYWYHAPFDILILQPSSVYYSRFTAGCQLLLSCINKNY